jgi:membrane-bound lytic murein transglycosylase B
MTADRGRSGPLKTLGPVAFLFVLFASILCAGHSNAGEDICSRKESLCQALRNEGFSDEEIQAVFSDERIALYPEILEKKGKGLNYLGRKFGLLTRKSVDRGRRILAENKTLLTDIGHRYKVEPEILVAIFRVETNFGGYVGTYPVFNSLLTMTLLENRRSTWAEKELVGLFILSRSNRVSPLSIKGSWAGAYGLCQFVPTSVLNYGADGNGDGMIDLFQFADAMASVASYLQAHGWQAGHADKKRKALYAYNHCDNYVDAVLAYAKATKNPPRKSRRRS